MASFQDALLCGAAGLVLWTCIGWLLASRLFDTTLTLAIAPVLGWSVHNALMLPWLSWIGMSRLTVALGAIIAVALAAVIRIRLRPADRTGPTVAFPWPAAVIAALAAIAIMMTLLPGSSAGSLTLSDAIFDHAKAALIDDIARLGVPAGNPFFSETGLPDRLAYYYFWHFSAAQLAVIANVPGWSADAGLTWFTAFASLMLMMGLAVAISGRRSAAWWVLLIAPAASIRPLFVMLLGVDLAHRLTGWPSGLAGWSFQIVWAPQHVAAAITLATAIIILIRLSQRPSIYPGILFGLLCAASFQSSTWIGGIVLAPAIAAAAVFLLLRMDAGPRGRFIGYAAMAAAIALGLAFPFIRDQLAASALRGDGAPIAVQAYDVIGENITIRGRGIINVMAYWTLFLFAEFAAFYPAGFIAIRLMARDAAVPKPLRDLAIALGLLALTGLFVSSAFVSTTGLNNDLAWRAVLPAAVVLIVLTAAGLGRYFHACRMSYVVIALASISSVYGVREIAKQISSPPRSSSSAFVQSEKMWDAVRRHASGGERVVNDPLFLADLTNWPINISWALLAQRRSCFAAYELALPFAPISRTQRHEVNEQFIRIFAGKPEPGDIDALADLFLCDVAVMTSRDRGWSSDPFRASSRYRLVEEDPQAWRIYRKQQGSAPATR